MNGLTRVWPTDDAEKDRKRASASLLTSSLSKKRRRPDDDGDDQDGDSSTKATPAKKFKPLEPVTKRSNTSKYVTIFALSQSLL